MTTYVIGINGGGTRTDFVVADETLKVLARVEGGATNYHNVGTEAAHHVLERGITDVLRLAGLRLDQITAIGAGLGGVDRPTDHMVFDQIFEAVAPGLSRVIDNDAVPALIAATGRRFGVVTISGTGSISYGLDEHGRRVRGGGWGYHFDRASGYAVAHESLAAISRAYDGIGLPTALTDQILARLGLPTMPSVIDWAYAPDRRPDQIAALAAITLGLAGTDPVATQIVMNAADELASEAISVAKRLGFEGKTFPLVASGSLLTRSTLFRDLFVSAVQATLPGAVPVESERDAAVGAAMMAMGDGVLDANLGVLPAPAMRRATEQRNRLTTTIQRRPTIDLVALMNAEDERVPRLVGRQLSQIAALIDAIVERFAQGGRIFFVGAGTSGRLGVLDASECRPTFGTTPEQVAGILAGGSEAFLSAKEGAEDDENLGRSEIASRRVGALDSIVGIAASGSTPFVQGALREAGERGALTASIANAAGAPISALAQHPIVVPTGPEVIMGSTRLKAGTAQKLVLNMISTGVMVRVGRTFGNLMTDMQMSNSKLRKRAEIIVAEATGLDAAAAADLLERCNGEMKTAIASAVLNVPPDEARQCVASANGNLSRCIERVDA